MFTVNNKDTRTILVSSFLILNSFHTLLFSCISVVNFEQVVRRRDGWHDKQSLSKKFFFFHFQTCAAMYLAEDGTKMGSI